MVRKCALLEISLFLNDFVLLQDKYSNRLGGFMKYIYLSFFVVACFISQARAGDHIDSPSAIASPSADITDTFAWMNADASKLNLVMNVFPNAQNDSVFSDAVQYVFHVTSQESMGAEGSAETRIICQFNVNQEVQCWIGSGVYISGDASSTSGLSNDGDTVKIFTGLRNDPFYFNATGFNLAVEGAKNFLEANANDVNAFDGADCPIIPDGRRLALVSQLASNEDLNEDPEDSFAGQNVLSIIIQLDKSLVNSGGNVLGVWASTHTRSE